MAGGRYIKLDLDVVRDRRISDGAKLMLGVLGSYDFGRRKGECWPGVADLSALAGIPQRTVKRQLAELVRAGFIERARRGKFATVTRFLDVPEMAPQEGDHDVPEMAPQEPVRGARTGTHVGPLLTVDGPEMALPYLMSERQKERPKENNEDSEFIAAGFKGPEDFESWFSDLHSKHPNPARRAAARTRLMDLVATRNFDGAAFEKRYAQWQQSPDWTDNNGRFAQNLFTFLDDGLYQREPRQPEVDTW